MAYGQEKQRITKSTKEKQKTRNDKATKDMDQINFVLQSIVIPACLWRESSCAAGSPIRTLGDDDFIESDVSGSCFEPYP